jgi:hypothetical protein
MALVDSRANTSAGGGWMLTLRDDGAVQASFYGTGSTLVLKSDSDLLTSEGRYQHLVMSLDADGSGSGTATFFVNGRQWGDPVGYTGASGYVEPDDVPFRIGHQRTDGSTGIQPFHGEISGFALYAKALDQGEVLERFQLGVPEPATGIMALFGAVFLLARWRKTRKV